MRYALTLVTLIALAEGILLWNLRRDLELQRWQADRFSELASRWRAAFHKLSAQRDRERGEAKLLVRQNIFLVQRLKHHRARADYFAGKTVTEIESFLKEQP